MGELTLKLLCHVVTQAGERSLSTLSPLSTQNRQEDWPCLSPAVLRRVGLAPHLRSTEELALDMGLQVSWLQEHRCRQARPGLPLICCSVALMRERCLLPSLILYSLWQPGDLDLVSQENCSCPSPVAGPLWRAKHAPHLSNRVELALVTGLSVSHP
jgi:hypothetical protein